jgi:hypothetical protein
MGRVIPASALFLLTIALAPAEPPPYSPERSAERIQVPEGFRATLFAGEPDLIKPIAMTTDDRGRLLTISS